MLFESFFEEEKLFTTDKINLKIVASGATIGAIMSEEIFKI